MAIDLARDPLLLATLLVLAALVVTLMAASPTAALALTLTGFAFTATLWGLPAQGALDMRAIALVAVLLSALRLGLARSACQEAPPRSGFLYLAMIAFGGYILASATWSSDPAKTLQSSAAWFVLVAMMVVFPRVVGRSTALRIIGATLATVVFLSALLALVGFPDAWSGPRARGVVLNPNGLGIFCMLASPFFLASRRRLMRIAWLVPAVLCVLTGSRAATAGLLVGAAAMMWRSPARRLRLLAAGILAAAVYAITPFSAATLFSNESAVVLLRDGNSREIVWDQALAVHASRPWLGVGMGALPTESGSSFLKVLSELGYVGTALALVTLGAAVRLTWPSTLGIGLLAGGVVDAVFEGWLFTAGSVYAVYFYLTAVSSVAREPEDSLRSLEPAVPHPAKTGPRQRRVGAESPSPHRSWPSTPRTGSSTDATEPSRSAAPSPDP